jgi:hypothetical protein
LGVFQNRSERGDKIKKIQIPSQETESQALKRIYRRDHAATSPTAK